MGNDNPLLSIVNRDGVCDLEGAFEEQRDDDGLEFKFSSGISSDIRRTTRGLESLDFGVWERSRCFGVLIGALEGFTDELL